MIKYRNKQVNKFKSNNNKLIIILYSEAKKEYFPTHEAYLTEVGVFPRSKIIKERIEKLGYKVILLPGNFNSIKKINNLKPFMAFNLVDSIRGDESLTPLIPSSLELLSIPYTGAGVTGLAINADKYLTKILLKQSGIPVPGFQLFINEKQKLDTSIHFPFIVKLNESHGSLEINQDSVVENEKNLRKRIKLLISKYNQSVLIEEYIFGKEITALMIEGKEEDQLLFAEERIFLNKEKYPLYSYEASWGDEEIYDVLQYQLNQEMKNNIVKAFKTLQFLDYARFEIIIDKKGRYYFIDSNANPEFGPYPATGGPFGYLLHINNISFDFVTKKIIENSINRFKNKKNTLDKSKK